MSSGAGPFREITGSEENMVVYMNEGNTAVNDSLSQSEVDALSKYHYGNAVVLNNALRDGEKDGGGFTQEDIKTLDSAIRHGSLKENTVLYRGVGSSFLGMDLKNPESVTGRTFTDKGYSSFSASKGVAEAYSHGVVFRLKANKGTKTAFVDGAIHSKSDLREYARDGDAGNFECLFKRNQSYKITGYERSGGRIVYDIEIK